MVSQSPAAAAVARQPHIQQMGTVGMLSIVAAKLLRLPLPLPLLLLPTPACAKLRGTLQCDQPISVQLCLIEDGDVKLDSGLPKGILQAAEIRLLQEGVVPVDAGKDLNITSSRRRFLRCRVPEASQNVVTHRMDAGCGRGASRRQRQQDGQFHYRCGRGTELWQVLGT